MKVWKEKEINEMMRDIEVYKGKKVKRLEMKIMEIKLDKKKRIDRGEGGMSLIWKLRDGI